MFISSICDFHSLFANILLLLKGLPDKWKTALKPPKNVLENCIKYNQRKMNQVSNFLAKNQMKWWFSSWLKPCYYCPCFKHLLEWYGYLRFSVIFFVIKTLQISLDFQYNLNSKLGKVYTWSKLKNFCFSFHFFLIITLCFWYFGAIMFFSLLFNKQFQIQHLKAKARWYKNFHLD